MHTRYAFVAGGLLALAPVCLPAQEVDMAQMMKWADAQIVAYSITGVYSAPTNLAYQDRSGQVADVTDRVNVQLRWNVQNNTMDGEAKVENFPSVAENVRNEVASCPPPVLKGAYEHLEVTGITSGEAQRVDLTGVRSFPEVDLTDCDGATHTRTVGRGQDNVVVYLPMPNPMLLAMPALASGGQMQVVVAPDKKSFVIKLNGWTWTYVPTRVS